VRVGFVDCSTGPFLGGLAVEVVQDEEGVEDHVRVPEVVGVAAGRVWAAPPRVCWLIPIFPISTDHFMSGS